MDNGILFTEHFSIVTTTTWQALCFQMDQLGMLHDPSWSSISTPQATFFDQNYITYTYPGVSTSETLEYLIPGITKGTIDGIEDTDSEGNSAQIL